jgi:hypothetical protein
MKRQFLDTFSSALFIFLVLMLPVVFTLSVFPDTFIGFVGILVAAAMAGGIVWMILCRIVTLIFDSTSSS